MTLSTRDELREFRTRRTSKCASNCPQADVVAELSTAGFPCTCCALPGPTIGHMDGGAVRLTVVLSGREAASPPMAVDVALGGPAGTCWVDLRAPLAAALGVSLSRVRALRVPSECALGEPPLIDGAIVSDAPAPPPEQALLQVQIEHGPDAGRRVALRPGDWSIGRAGADLTLGRDPRVSRRQGRLRVGHSGVELETPARANPTLVNEQRVAGRVALTVGDRVTVGSTRLRLAVADAQARPREHPQPQTFALPSTPTAPDPPAFSWLTAVIGLAVSCGLAVALGSPIFMLFGVAGPLLAGAQWLGQRHQLRRTHAAKLRAHDSAMVDLRTAATNALSHELRLRRRGSSLADTHGTRGDGGDDYEVVLGVGPVCSEVQISAGDDTSALWLADAPLRRTLPEVLNVTGPGAEALTWGLIGQLAARPPTSRLTIAVVSDRLARWSWVAWLPQARRAAVADPQELAGSIWMARSAQAPALVSALGEVIGRGDLVLLVWDQAARPPILPPARVLWLSPRAAGEAQVHVWRDGRLTESVDGDTRRLGTADLPSRTWATARARALAPHPARACPSTRDVRLIDLRGRPKAAEVAAAWSRQPRDAASGLAAVIGVTTCGPITGEPVPIDLSGGCPHLLVAGTTGSGKSELLRTLVVSLALAYPPSDLNVVLIDYKGGAAFGACAQLPHTAGLVTDLDSGDTARAIAGLRAELRRRERVLAEVGAPDLSAYRRLTEAGRGTAPMPRIVVLVDEFRVLADELPDGVAALVRLASQGRSLGLHLVLATQRPTGAISAEMRANISTRIALRTADQLESRDVVDCPDAATLAVSSPGRAVMRVGSEPPTQLQCARVDVCTPVARPWAALAPPEALALAPDGTGVPRSATVDDDLSTLVATITEAADLSDAVRPRRLWCDRLPELLAAEDLAPDEVPGRLPLGLLDDPAAQRQCTLGWTPALDGSLAVVGATGSGRTSTMRRLLLVGHRAAATWVVLDLRGGLDDLANLPWVRGLATADDPEALRTVLDSVQDQPHNTIVVVHGWDEADLVPQLDLRTRLGTMVHRSRPGTCALAVSGGRALLGSRLFADLPNRVVHRLGDPMDAGLAGLRRDALPTPWPPGRAVVNIAGWDGPRHLQVALPPTGAPHADAATSEPATRARPPPPRPSRTAGTQAGDRHEPTASQGLSPRRAGR